MYYTEKKEREKNQSGFQSFQEYYNDNVFLLLLLKTYTYFGHIYSYIFI